MIINHNKQSTIAKFLILVFIFCLRYVFMYSLLNESNRSSANRHGNIFGAKLQEITLSPMISSRNRHLLIGASEVEK